MFENVKAGEFVTVHFDDATTVAGIVSEVGDSWVSFLGDITVYESDGWEVVK